jgi:hypothetical protein
VLTVSGDSRDNSIVISRDAAGKLLVERRRDRRRRRHADGRQHAR